MFDIPLIGAAICLGCLGTALGLILPPLLFRGSPPGIRNGRYVGGLPIVLAVSLPPLVAGIPLWPEGGLIIVASLVGAFLGLLRDFRVCRTRTAILGLVVSSLVGAVIASRSGVIPAGWGTAIGAVWPILVVVSLRTSALVFEIPFLLAMISGLTFLLFFPSQVSTPPWAVLFTVSMILPPFAALGLWFITGKKRQFGDSGWFALGSLLAGISLVGRSKTLLLLGLLFPAMVIVFPIAAICLLIFTSYLGNELYQLGSGERYPAWSWNLTRENVLLYTALSCLSLNFVGLLLVVQATWWAWLALVALAIASGAGFWKTFAHRARKDQPTATKIRILRVNVDPITFEQSLSKIESWLGSKEGFYHIVTADSLAVLKAFKDPSFAGLMEMAAMTVPDGAGLVWAADFLGTPLPGRVPGIGLVQEICAMAARRGFRVFFLGAKPEVSAAAAEAMVKLHPGLTIAGTHHGFFRPGTPEETEVLKTLRLANPDIVFVALGVPRQEEFINGIRADFPGRPVVAIGVGGSFDVISGRIPRAPLLMQRFALEWLFRLWVEPGRISRIYQIPRFVYQVFRVKLQSKR